MKPSIRTAALSVAALTATVLLASCSGGHDMNNMGGHEMGGTAASASASTAAGYNDSDVMFAQMMIPHHQQALEMAQLAGGRAASPQVKELAKKIEAAQTPEIDTLTKWLTGDGKPTAAMNHGGTSGMMTMSDMEKLKAANGADFDKQFLAMMVEHHNGAIQMAAEESAKGADAQLKQMAASIKQGQSIEVTTMKQLLAG